MRLAIETSSDALLGDPDALGIAVEGLGGPEGGALLLFAAVAIERARRRQQLADRGDGAAVLELGQRLGEELPRLVAMRPQPDDVVGAGRRERGERLGVRPSGDGDEPPAARPLRREREVRTARGLVQDGERLATQDVRVPGQVQERDSAVEIRGMLRRLVVLCGSSHLTGCSSQSLSGAM